MAVNMGVVGSCLWRKMNDIKSDEMQHDWSDQLGLKKIGFVLFRLSLTFWIWVACKRSDLACFCLLCPPPRFGPISRDCDQQWTHLHLEAPWRTYWKNCMNIFHRCKLSRRCSDINLKHTRVCVCHSYWTPSHHYCCAGNPLIKSCSHLLLNVLFTCSAQCVPVLCLMMSLPLLFYRTDFIRPNSQNAVNWWISEKPTSDGHRRTDRWP